MTDSQKLKLLKLVEVQVAGILIENKICEYVIKPKNSDTKKVHNKFTNLKILPPYDSEIDFYNISTEKIQDIRNIYPKGSDRKGDVVTIKKKLEKFLSQYPQYTYEDIVNVIKNYTIDSIYNGKRDMLFDLNNIFYKLENNQFLKSPIIGLIEKYGTKSVDNIPVIDEVSLDIDEISLE